MVSCLPTSPSALACAAAAASVAAARELTTRGEWLRWRARARAAVAESRFVLISVAVLLTEQIALYLESRKIGSGFLTPSLPRRYLGKLGVAEWHKALVK